MSKYNVKLDLEHRNSLSVLISRVRPNTKVLEFGPAHGRMTKYLKENLNCSVCAVELDEEAAKDAAKFTDKIVTGNIENYTWVDEFNGRKFDYIIFADVLEHLYYPESVLEKAKEFLSENGSILVSIPNIAHGAIVIDLLNNKFNYHSTGLLDNTHIRFFTSKTFKELLDKLGYHIAYESAIFLHPKNTEFKNHYDMLPSEVGNYLERHKFLNIYQLVFEVKTHECTHISDVNDFATWNYAQLFIDQGKGFSEEESILLPVRQDNEYQILEVDMETFGGIRQLRFDPLDDSCVIEIESFDLVMQNGNKFSMKNNLLTNCCLQEPGDIYLFDHEDPQISFNLDMENMAISKLSIKIRYLAVARQAIAYCNTSFAKLTFESQNTIKALEVKIATLHDKILEKDKQNQLFESKVQSLGSTILEKDKLNQLCESKIQSLETEIIELENKFRLFQKPKLIRIAAKMEKLRKKYSNSYKKRRDKIRGLFQKKITQSTPIEPLKDRLYVDTLNNYFVNNFIIPDLNSDKPIDIIIPVYNGFEFLEPLFKSIIRNTSIPYRLLVCDDKSSDERVLPFLKKVKLNNEHVEFILIENKINLGFIKTVNKLVELVENHFVLLNTDTEVPPYWLERLMYPIFKMDRVASTTPFTNAGTICSFPEYLKDNSIYQELGVSELDSFFQKVNFEQTMIEIPTGVGFCMGVNKDLVNKIGMFDEVFGKGYGEENDWCQRAIAAGYRNIHVTNLFVYHKHGGSFASSEKQQLISQNLLLLNGRYPNYQRDIENTIQKNELEIIRNLIQLKVMNESTYTTLIIDHYLGGGANHYTADRIRSKKSEISIILRYDFLSSKRFIIEFTMGSLQLTCFSSSFEDCLLYLSEFQINEVFINSLVSFPNVKDHIVKILQFKEELQAKLVVPVHDYFMLCPSYTLINEKTTYCGVPSDLKVCSSCLKHNDNEFKLFEKEKDIIEWRKSWGDIIQLSDEILCFSKSSKDIVVKAYPNCEGKIKVTPHNISGRYPNIYQSHKIADRVTIGILGGINVAKGAKVVKNLVEYIDSNRINAKIVLIGEISTPIDSPSFQVTGRYNREELPDLVKQYCIDKFLIPSIWPETYSYATDEIMQMGYPVIVFNLGAPAERVRNYERGKVIAIDDIEKELFSHEDI